MTRAHEVETIILKEMRKDQRFTIFAETVVNLNICFL